MFLLLICSFFISVSTSSLAAQIGFEYFNQTLFKNECSICHSGSSPPGDLRLETYQDFTSLIVEGSPEASELIDRLSTDNPDRRMPPYFNWQIDPSELEKLKDWIKRGAPEMGENPNQLGAASFANIKEKILRPKCMECHTDPSLNLENLKRLVKAERPEQSFLYNLLTTDDLKLRMPLAKGKLTAQEIRLIRDWIKLGCPDEPKL